MLVTSTCFTAALCKVLYNTLKKSALQLSDKSATCGITDGRSCTRSWHATAQDVVSLVLPGLCGESPLGFLAFLFLASGAASSSRNMSSSVFSMSPCGPQQEHSVGHNLMFLFDSMSLQQEETLVLDRRQQPSAVLDFCLTLCLSKAPSICSSTVVHVLAVTRRYTLNCSLVRCESVKSCVRCLNVQTKVER